MRPCAHVATAGILPGIGKLVPNPKQAARILQQLGQASAEPRLCSCHDAYAVYIQAAAGREQPRVHWGAASGGGRLQGLASRVYGARQSRPVDLLAAQMCGGLPPPAAHLHQRQL